MLDDIRQAAARQRTARAVRRMKLDCKRLLSEKGELGGMVQARDLIDRLDEMADEQLDEFFDFLAADLSPEPKAVLAAAEAGADVILTLGGTGVGPRDQTPEGSRPRIEQELPGIPEGLRRAGAIATPTAVLSRGLAGISRPGPDGHRSVIVNLPGSTGGARDGVEFLAPVLPHLIDQLRGGDH